jgi:hypothetical protein
MDDGTKSFLMFGSAGTVIFCVLCSIVAVGMYGCPKYQVYEQRLVGEAELAKANYSKQVAVQEAVAKEEAAKHLANVDVERAKGVAEANRIIGNSLKNNDSYLEWLYIEGLKERTGMETIYVPTEAGLPILEAGRRSNRKGQ